MQLPASRTVAEKSRIPRASHMTFKGRVQDKKAGRQRSRETDRSTHRQTDRKKGSLRSTSLFKDLREQAFCLKLIHPTSAPLTEKREPKTKTNVTTPGSISALSAWNSQGQEVVIHSISPGHLIWLLCSKISFISEALSLYIAAII